MVDQTKKPDPSLLKKIEELEALLQKQRQKRLENTAVPTKAETEQIPVLRDVVTGQSIAAENKRMQKQFEEKQTQDVMGIVDQHTRSDLEELVKLLKHNIIDELKTELMKELKPLKKGEKTDL